MDTATRSRVDRGGEAGQAPPTRKALAGAPLRAGEHAADPPPGGLRLHATSDHRSLPLPRVRREVAHTKQIREVGGSADAVALVSDSCSERSVPALACVASDRGVR